MGYERAEKRSARKADGDRLGVARPQRRLGIMVPLRALVNGSKPRAESIKALAIGVTFPIYKMTRILLASVAKVVWLELPISELVIPCPCTSTFY